MYNKRKEIEIPYINVNELSMYYIFCYFRTFHVTIWDMIYLFKFYLYYCCDLI